MRAFVAILALAAWPCFDARDATLDYVPRELLDALQIEGTPVENLLTCGQTLGPARCLTALGAWRAANAAGALSKPEAHFNLTEDVQAFPWQQYSNRSDGQLYSELCDGTEKLLQHRALKLNLIPGYSFELKSRDNGTLNIDVFSNDAADSARSSMKKMRKQFYRIVPLLLVPGLIMSAILPFILPALKMAVVGVGMLNNMALTSAVFTLLRNNAFSDTNHKKVVYLNAGYRNQKKPEQYEETQYHDVYENFEEMNHEDSHMLGSNQHLVFAGDDFNNVAEVPDNEWVDDYYGSKNKFFNILAYKNRRNMIDKPKTTAL